jgi:diguanylate cyclase (GGDEF)-like protein/PAS domain S-box-containing protein
MIVVLDPRGRIVRLNRTAIEHLGVTLDSVKGLDWFDLFVDDEDRDEIRRVFRDLVAGGRGERGDAEYPLRVGNGRELHAIWYRRLLRDEQGNVTGLLSAGFDITERRRLEEALHTLAMQDELTGLYNRRGFRDVARRHAHLADRNDRRAYVFFMDVDGLKEINDTYGHLAGDHALRCAADVLRGTFRTSDVIGRIGGDEFAALAMVETETDLFALLQRLDERRVSPCSYDGTPFALRLSLGVAPVQSNGLGSIDRALAEADQVMYREREQDHSRVRG